MLVTCGLATARRADTAEAIVPIPNPPPAAPLSYQLLPESSFWPGALLGRSWNVTVR